MSSPLYEKSMIGLQWAYIDHQDACEMPKLTKSPEGPRKTQLKIYVTAAFKKEVEQFHAEHRELGSMGDIGIAALSFFMEKYRESGRHRDHKGFPAQLVAEIHTPYETRGRPHQKK